MKARVCWIGAVVLCGCASPTPPRALPGPSVIPLVEPEHPTSDRRAPFAAESLEGAVARSLGAMLGAPAQALDVTINDDVVTLSGSVSSVALRWNAVEAVAAVEGVRAVVDQLTLDPPAGSDQELAADVRELLASAPATGGEPTITVAADRHVITLDGDVSTDAVARRAAALAATVRGVLEVQNRLRPRLAEQGSEPAEQLRRDVLATMARAPAVPKVQVAVSDGRVTLTGRVGRAEDRRELLGRAWVAGVRAVDGRALTYVWWTGERPPKSWRGPRPFDDEAFEPALSSTLETDGRFATSALDPRSQDGVVTWRGRVPSRAIQRLAESVAHLWPGARDVRWRAHVDPTMISDAKVALAVRESLARDPFVGTRDVVVRANGGQVTLTGAVDDSDTRDRAQYLAAGIPGVTNVESQLRLSQPDRGPRG
jgi:osmotically-inducible protein OsmY